MMQKKELMESVGKYIDKYYIPANDDIRLDKEMKDIFQKIADFCQKRKQEKKVIDDNDKMEYEIDESAISEFDESNMQKTKVFHTMSSTMATNRKIDDLMSQMEETFSQRLLRMIDERLK